MFFITFILTIAMIIFTYKGIIPTELFVTTTSAVFTYFFTRKENGGANDNQRTF